MKKIIFYISLWICATACFEIPEEGTISDHMSFSMREVPIYLKTQQIIGEGYGLKITAGETTFPFRFTIEKITKINEDGSLGEEVTSLFNRKVAIRKWKAAFTKEEKNREEFEAKRETVEEPILFFSQSNDLIFNYGDENIETGIYALDIRVTNSSGTKLYKDMLRLNVKGMTPYLLMPGRDVYGADEADSYTVTLEKKGHDRENLTIQIHEKTGDIVPLDSLIYDSDSYSFKNVFHFSQTHTANQGTNIDIPFPVPYNPVNITYPQNIYRGVTLSAKRYGDIKEWVQKEDEEGNPVFDPETGEPVMVERTVRKLRYGFSSLRFMINEPGDWLMTIKYN